MRIDAGFSFFFCHAVNCNQTRDTYKIYSSINNQRASFGNIFLESLLLLLLLCEIINWGEYFTIWTINDKFYFYVNCTCDRFDAIKVIKVYLNMRSTKKLISVIVSKVLQITTNTFLLLYKSPFRHVYKTISIPDDICLLQI